MDASKELEQNIRSILKKVATDMSRDLKRQVPQRGQNPYATGNLKSKFNLDVRKTTRNEWEIFITYPFYGNYTAYGTRQYSNWREQEPLNIFDRAPFRGYSKGRNGIVPQNWLSLRQQKMQYEDMIQEQLGESLEVFMNRLTTIGIRTR
tara:strand:+ start:169 stop:615 length:447 start_codon:yes stop_codon:yes gene_type:complete